MVGYKTYQTFDEFVADQAADKRGILTTLRQYVNDTVPLTESSKWGNGVWLSGDLPVVFVHVESDHVQLGFFAGAQLDDPAKILEGNAKYVRHVKVHSPEEIDRAILMPIIRQAATLDYKNK